VAGGSIATALRAMLRDAGRHRSPNAGWPEAAMAAALSLALAGPRHYSGIIVSDPFLNEHGRRDARPEDIWRALRVYLAANALFFAVVTAGALAVFFAR
jgi:adenosylcobinamide-phosphate synthase